MLDLLIFSKDRPAQLDLLLRSLMRFILPDRRVRARVIWKSSDHDFRDGYAKITQKHGGRCEFVEERDFRSDVVRFVTEATSAIMFMVDDDIALSRFSTDSSEFREFLRNPELSCLSLRLHPGIRYCYTKSIETPPPEFLSGLRWKWRGCPGDWGYPMSLDGHIFRRDDLLPLLSVGFRSPNHLESVLAEKPLPKELMICVRSPCVVNVPANRVQDDFPNRHMGMDPRGMNRQFLDGEELDIERALDGVTGSAVHQEIDLVFHREPQQVPQESPAEWTRAHITAPLKAQPEYYEHLVGKLRAMVSSISPELADDSPPSLKKWWAYSMKIRGKILTEDPASFLKWDIIRETMFVGNSGYIRHELNYLQSLDDWESRWKGVLPESSLGFPEPYVDLPFSSGNLIHHAYHLATWMKSAGIRLDGIRRIVEFGGGYGSLCRLFFRLGFSGVYEIYDIPVFSALQAFYLEALGMDIIDFSAQNRELAKLTIGTGGKTASETDGVSLFVATWSLSESPIALREWVLSRIEQRSAYLIAFQERFEEVDNIAYFRTLTQNTPGMKWKLCRIEHIPKSWYLWGFPEGK